MTVAIPVNNKIVKFSLVKENNESINHSTINDISNNANSNPNNNDTQIGKSEMPATATATTTTITQMHESIKRPEVLFGSSYKIQTPLSEHALYITINDIILNEGTENEHRRPFEIFINSKNMENFQWIVALTRVISALFRKGGDIAFIVEELQSVFDPKGGYFKRGGKYMPSLVAELGEVINLHLEKIGLMTPKQLPQASNSITADQETGQEDTQDTTDTKVNQDIPQQLSSDEVKKVKESILEYIKHKGSSDITSIELRDNCAKEFYNKRLCVQRVTGKLMKNLGYNARQVRHVTNNAVTTCRVYTKASPSINITVDDNYNINVKKDYTDSWNKKTALCPKCNSRTITVNGGCKICINCGESKCE